MKPKRTIITQSTVTVVLAAAFLVLCLLLAFTQPGYLLPVAVLVAVVAAMVVFSMRQLRRRLRVLLNGRGALDAMGESGFAALGMPVAVLDGKTLVWYNDAFLHAMCTGQDAMLAPINKIVPGLEVKTTLETDGQNITVGDCRYTAYSSSLSSHEGLHIVLFVENTQLKTQAAEYLATRPAVMYIVIDTYEVIRELKESEQMQILAGVDQALEQYIAKNNGFIRRVSASRYVAVVEERHIQKMADNRFDILDTVRKSGADGAFATLSIGVGRLAATLQKGEEQALQALDMALGRGGDQAAVNSPDGYTFYGGVSRTVEKRERVKSRIVASKIKDLIAKSDLVLVMGHKNADMDSLGAAVGMLRFCKMCQKPAGIVLNKGHTLAESLLDVLENAGYAEDILLPEVALPLVTPSTLLIVVDTHMKYLLESLPVYEAAQNLVVIDHHRKMVGHIDNAQVFYHEPYSSSASELVSELLQYMESEHDEKPTAADAEALLAGIMLDTRTFSLHVGVRTFEAAAYLRRLGARTDAVKKLFASSLDEYVYRSQLVAEAQIYRNCAIVVSDEVPAECEVVAPQAANDLLTIEGVLASIVAVECGGQVRVSARSMGEINVQLIMEKLGGGGHLTMAGAQLKCEELATCKKSIMQAVDNYFNERTMG